MMEEEFRRWIDNCLVYGDISIEEIEEILSDDSKKSITLFQEFIAIENHYVWAFVRGILKKYTKEINPNLGSTEAR